MDKARPRRASSGRIPEIGTLRAINGKRISKKDDLAEISARLDGALRKNRVNLTISNHLSQKEATYWVKPSASQPSSVTWRRVGADMLVHIRDFSAHDTSSRIYALYKTLLATAGTQVILDLRGCSGGDLYEALEMAGMFVPPDLPLASIYNRKGKVRTYRAPSGQKLAGPNWVFIDRRTASAAEIFAGILQHYRLARLVGEQTFGKFVSQTVFTLPDAGEFWLTTLEIRLPDDISRVKKNGIKPDIFYPDISITRTSDIIGIINKGY